MRRARDVVRPDGSVVRRKPVVGDMRWDGKRWLRWSGRQWAPAAYSLSPGRLRERPAFQAETPIAEDRQRHLPALAVEDQVAVHGATVVLDGPGGVVLAFRRHVSHLLHAFLTLVTGGIWAVVWLAIALSNKDDRVRLEVDDWGNVWPRSVVSP